ncbi:cyclic GMP-AMP synthase-like [Chrysoperla carnea]|uniref:cyclic GMP-AMP synthase-like n=1 Tax=Chrysoperla carnea TaxID=189513 RepID=UPI001D08D1F3|nr:cyclic GMP-AMP synthase-like [Chrysoperla carnea]
MFIESRAGLPNGNKYDVVESELNYINSKFISLNYEEKRATSDFFTEFIPSFVKGMKAVDKLFDSTFQSILYAGSYFEGLKVGKPDEYDLDLIFKLPINYDELEITSSPERPGYVKIRLSDLEHRRLVKDQHWNECYRKVMAKWFDDDKFFLPDKFRFWLQSVVQKTLNRYICSNELAVYVSTSGPAITLHVLKASTWQRIEFSVDLVPVLRIYNRHPPPEICRTHIRDAHISSGRILSWYVVPKPVKSDYIYSRVNLNWRLAFHDHERILISGNERLKPALRLLKKFRDSRNFSKIASYYLKTICLWELDKPENSNIWTWGSLSYVFVHLLKAFYDSLKVGKIPYYWQKEHNLLSDINQSTIADMSYLLKKIIDKIETDPKLIPQLILSTEEYQLYKYEQSQRNEIEQSERCRIEEHFRVNYEHAADSRNESSLFWRVNVPKFVRATLNLYFSQQKTHQPIQE